MRMISALAMSLSIVACSQEAHQAGPTEEAVASPAAPRFSEAKISAAIAELRKEPKIIDLVYAPGNVVDWTVGVKDNGTPRFGYAEFLCLRLAELGLRDEQTMVRIVDYGRYMAPNGNARDADLGTVRCQTGEHFSP